MPEQTYPTRPPRRWLSYSLRSLLVSTMLVGCMMGWIVKEGRQSEHERELGKRLEEHWLVRFGGVWDLPNANPKERTWWRVRAQNVLGDRILGVCTGSSEGDLSMLAELSKLQRISGSPRNTASLAPIAGLTDLVTVSVARTQVSDLTPLEGLQHLTVLNLNATNITDITPLARLKRLERLLLARTQVKDLTPLAGLTNLQELDIAETQVCDLTPLIGLKQLERLSITMPPVTEQQLAELQISLPACKIKHDPSKGRSAPIRTRITID